MDPPLRTFKFFQQYKSPVKLLRSDYYVCLIDRCEDFQNMRWGQDPNNEDDWKQYDFYDQLVTAEVSVKFIPDF